VSNTVTIPMPSKIPAGRGIDAARSLHWPFPVRLSVEDVRLVEEISKRLGLSKGMFIRSCAVLVAKELMRRDGGDDDDGNKADA
jgi:hypothetical protein